MTTETARRNRGGRPPVGADGMFVGLGTAVVLDALEDPAIGQPVIHVPAWQVCTGRSRGVVSAGVPRRQTTGA